MSERLEIGENNGPSKLSTMLSSTSISSKQQKGRKIIEVVDSTDSTEENGGDMDNNTQDTNKDTNEDTTKRMNKSIKKINVVEDSDDSDEEGEGGDDDLPPPIHDSIQEALKSQDDGNTGLAGKGPTPPPHRRDQALWRK